MCPAPAGVTVPAVVAEIDQIWGIVQAAATGLIWVTVPEEAIGRVVETVPTSVIDQEGETDPISVTVPLRGNCRTF